MDCHQGRRKQNLRSQELPSHNKIVTIFSVLFKLPLQHHQHLPPPLPLLLPPLSSHTLPSLNNETFFPSVVVSHLVALMTVPPTHLHRATPRQQQQDLQCFEKFLQRLGRLHMSLFMTRRCGC